MMTYRLSAHQKLSDIARLHGVTTEAIVGANPQKETVLVPGVGEVFADLSEGEAIRIPGLSQSPNHEPQIPPGEAGLGDASSDQSARGTMEGAIFGGILGAMAGAAVGVGVGFLLGNPAKGAGIGSVIGAAIVGFDVATKGIN